MLYSFRSLTVGGLKLCKISLKPIEYIEEFKGNEEACIKEDWVLSFRARVDLEVMAMKG